MSPQLVATLFLCVAYTPASHTHLANPEVLRRLLEACRMERAFGQDDDENLDSLMLQLVQRAEWPVD